jgi:hypothetical protein
LAAASLCFAQAELTAPRDIAAGTAISIPTTGSGEATFYLVGPARLLKQKVQLGTAIQLNTEDTSAAGRYVATICSQTCRSAHFFVLPGGVSKLSFLAHPSRALVQRNDSISGVVFPFDQHNNLVTAPMTINFQVSVNNASLFSRPVATRYGAAWFRADSGSKAGLAQLTATVKDVSSRRVLQLVAAEPCSLRIKAQRGAKGIMVETDPVRDCSGNTLPDGTMVTFSASSAAGHSTVDTPIKQGVARAQLSTRGNTVISAASGVVMGNQIEVRP